VDAGCEREVSADRVPPTDRGPKKSTRGRGTAEMLELRKYVAFSDLLLRSDSGPASIDRRLIRCGGGERNREPSGVFCFLLMARSPSA